MVLPFIAPTGAENKNRTLQPDEVVDVWQAFAALHPEAAIPPEDIIKTMEGGGISSKAIAEGSTLSSTHVEQE
jgi:hypothetical protein